MPSTQSTKDAPRRSASWLTDVVEASKHRDALQAVVSALGIDASAAMAGRHWQFPGCKKTKARISDRDTGAGGCDCGCGRRWRDLVAMAKEAKGSETMGEAAEWVAEVIRYKIPERKAAGRPPGSKIDPKRHLSLVPKDGSYPSLDELAQQWCERKGGVTIQALARIGTRIKLYRCKTESKLHHGQDKWEKLPVIAIPVWGSKGSNAEPVNWLVSRCDGENLPMFDRTGAPLESIKIKTIGGSARGLIGVPDQIDALLAGTLPAETECWKTEGPTDLLALLSRSDLPPGWFIWTNPFGARDYVKNPQWLLDAFRGRILRLVHDADEPGQFGAAGFGKAFAAFALEVRNVQLPYALEKTHGQDLRDFLKEGGTVATLLERVAAADAVVAESQDPMRPRVMLTLNEGFTAEQVAGHIGQLGWKSPWLDDSLGESVKVFVRGGVLVHTIEGEDPVNRGRLSIRPVPPCIVRERITQACQLETEKQSGDDVVIVPARPPKWLVDAIHQRGHYGGKIKPLTGVVYSPTLRRDGSVLQQAGYDDATALLYQPTAEFPHVPESPGREDAMRALQSLLDVVVDFPFVDDADRSAWLALVLSMIGRSCIGGCVPLFAITANIRGSGKSLLTDAASLIAYGRPAARKPFTRDDDELRKVITSVAMEAIPSVLFDNVDVQLGGATLDLALTSDVYSDRILGSNRTTGELPMRTVFSATGNNLAFGSDMGRRVLPIRLQSPLESPEDRSGFTHPDLLKWVSDNRPRLAVDALTVLRAFFAAGCPGQPNGEFGSFEEWSRLVRGAIVWAGGADPLVTRVTAKESDDSLRLLGMLITGIEEADPFGSGLTAKEVERLTTHRPDDAPTCPTLVEAASLICGDRFNARRFGCRCRAYGGRIWHGRMLVSEPGHGGVNRWKIRRAEPTAGGLVGFDESADGQTHQSETRETQGKCVSGGFGGFGGFDSDSTRKSNDEIARDNFRNAYTERGNQNPPHPSNPPWGCSEGHDPIDQPSHDGRIRTSCRRCKKFIGYRPMEVGR